MDISKKTTVCKSKKTNEYSVRIEGDLFWTGVKKDSWVKEEEQNEIWESKDRALVYSFSLLMDYVIISDKTVQGVINELN